MEYEHVISHRNLEPQNNTTVQHLSKNLSGSVTINQSTITPVHEARFKKLFCRMSMNKKIFVNKL